MNDTTFCVVNGLKIVEEANTLGISQIFIQVSSAARYYIIIICMALLCKAMPWFPKRTSTACLGLICKHCTVAVAVEMEWLCTFRNCTLCNFVVACSMMIIITTARSRKRGNSELLQSERDGSARGLCVGGNVEPW